MDYLQFLTDIQFNQAAGDSIETEMKKDYSYPSPSAPDFQNSIYEKRDFHIHTIPPKPIITAQNKLTEFYKKCTANVKLTETQIALANFINPVTPYRGVLIYHGTGVGKTCAAVTIAEKFKPMVQKYNTRIHVLVPGPLNKQNFLMEIIKCTGNTYHQVDNNQTVIVDENDKAKINRMAISMVNQYYRIMSHRSFQKKVLGERIKSTSGEATYEREFSNDRIYNLDNSLLIVDEAHNLTGNNYGEALKKIIVESKNLRVVLLTATPMKNLADDIVELINYLRPLNNQMKRDKIFTVNRGSKMQFKEGGQRYLAKMVSGYVSYLRGADPVTFAERIDMGHIPDGLIFTKVIQCYMQPFQKNAYDKALHAADDKLDKISEAVSNFVFPGLSNTGSLIGYYGKEGLHQVRHQLNVSKHGFNDKIKSVLFANEKKMDNQPLLYVTSNRTINGAIFKEAYLSQFSIKFYTALQEINKAVYGLKGEGLLFIYSNLVEVGVNLFVQVLLQNGYLQFEEDSTNYQITDDTKCYFCGINHKNHLNLPHNLPTHSFHPATFISIVGRSDDSLDIIPEEKYRVLNTVFNDSANQKGKLIKIIIGSKVMNEGITLKNIQEIHILDVHHTLGRVDQVIGRGIRFCKHYDVINPTNLFPQVKIYKYVVSIKDGLSREEILYQKAEQKYQLVKETERILQEEAIDCPLNRNGNVFKEEVIRYKDCRFPDKPCPAICGYMPCDFKCSSKKLNWKHYDPASNLYRKIAKADLDYSTYDNSLASEEINYARTKIKEMYYLDHLYTLTDILNYVQKSLPVDQLEMFDNYYVYQALNDLIPITNNDFNNFREVLIDKYNRMGYLIYRRYYYIFQPFDENEDLPIYYRKNYLPTITDAISLKNYLKQSTLSLHPSIMLQTYDFQAAQDYYDNRPEFEYVGIIDKNSTSGLDEFKIRQRRPKILHKRRETGIPSFKGAVCNTSKNKSFLIAIAQSLQLNANVNNVRNVICKAIEAKMIDLEKYATTKNNNKVTYLIIPRNHPTYPFPLNLEDRLKYLIDSIKQSTHQSSNPIIESFPTTGKFKDIEYTSYRVYFGHAYDTFAQIMMDHGAQAVDNGWLIMVQ